MFKKFFLFLLIVLFFQSLTIAQDSTNTKPIDTSNTTHLLLHFSKPKYLGIYISPEYQYGQLQSAFGSYSGASVMLLLNKKWGIGVSAMANMSDRNQTSVLKGDWGGLKLEYTPKPNAAFHLSFPLFIGMGNVKNDSTDINHNGVIEGDFFGESRHGANFVIIQPSVQLEANLFRFAKFYAGVNYRFSFSAGNSTTTLPGNALSGVSFNTGFKLGLFDHKVRTTVPKSDSTSAMPVN